jgi:DNA-binding transcriptional ArsR family regulator
MVERESNLDLIFKSLADGTRRDILKQVSKHDCSISELAQLYHMSFAAVAKHVHVLEVAGLVKKQRQGKQQIVRIIPSTFTKAQNQLVQYQEMWRARFDELDNLLLG